MTALFSSRFIFTNATFKFKKLECVIFMYVILYLQIILKAKSPVQADGEPWEQTPTQIKISLANKASVLKSVNRN